MKEEECQRFQILKAMRFVPSSVLDFEETFFQIFQMWDFSLLETIPESLLLQEGALTLSRQLFICANSTRLYSERWPKLVSAQQRDTNTTEPSELQLACSLTIVSHQINPSHGQCCSSPFNITGVLIQFCITVLSLELHWVSQC